MFEPNLADFKSILPEMTVEQKFNAAIKKKNENFETIKELTGKKLDLQEESLLVTDDHKEERVFAETQLEILYQGFDQVFDDNTLNFGYTPQLINFDNYKDKLLDYYNLNTIKSAQTTYSNPTNMLGGVWRVDDFK